MKGALDDYASAVREGAMITTSSVNQVIIFEESLANPSILEEVFPCRCGVTHRGEHGRDEFIHHNCYHSHLEVIGASPDGKMTVYCADCEAAWLAPVKCEGLSVSLTGTGLSQGCEWCQGYVMQKLTDDKPDHLDYLCPDCKYHWKLDAA